MSKHPFAPGDVVVKVAGNRFIGRIGRVSECRTNIQGRHGINLLGWHPDPFYVAFKAENFRHIGKADDTFTEQMRALKPQRGKVSA